MNLKDNVYVSFSPHMYDKASSSRIMLDVIIALLPAFFAGCIIFGWRAVLVTCVCITSCLVFEAAYQKLLKKPVSIKDFTAVITGMLLAYNLPPGIPLWQAVFGSFIAIVVVKQLFGGLGKNFANPAITARVIMLLSFSVSMTTWSEIPDALSSATPLNLLSRGDIHLLPSLKDMFLGLRGGCIGESSALALLLGAAYLFIRRVISWHIPLTFIGTVFIFSFFYVGGLNGQIIELTLYHVLSGGLLLGAFFMATDYVTSPQTNLGKLIFGFGCGVVTVVIRFFGNYPEGVSFGILLMNVLVPYINKLTFHKAFGGIKS